MEKSETAAAPEVKDKTRSLPAYVVIAAFALLVGFLALIAWGLNRAQQPPIQVGDRVPPFTLTTFGGDQVGLADLSGKVVVVNFWASWCKPCEQEAADLQTVWMNNKEKNQVMFLGVDWVDTEVPAKQYIDKFKITYPNGPDLRTSISQLFRIKGVPETYFIGKDGRLKDVKIGPFNSAAELQEKIDALLQ